MNPQVQHTFAISSSAFSEGGDIPRRHTCDGANSSPPLRWHDAPAGTTTFAMIVDDPDAPDPAAPQRVWVHWLPYDIPATCTELEEGVDVARLPGPVHVAVNDGDHARYDGPCPPIGSHRYFFTLYALDVALGDLGARARRADLERAMEGHVLGTASLMGRYARRHPSQ